MKSSRIIGSTDQARRRLARWLPACACLLAGFSTARAELLPESLLVVYNSLSPDASRVLDVYLEAHPDVLPEHVLDLRAPQLVGRADIDYEEFIRLIRRPIRSFLSTSPRHPDAISCILLIRGLPHRIRDINKPGLGDRPQEAAEEFLMNGNVTYASVDSELTLLWQNLERGEYGLTMDSLADNVIANPYHGADYGVSDVSRQNITFRKVLNNADDVAWLTDEVGIVAIMPGDFYLVSRIDGTSTEDAMAMIRRGGDLLVNRARTAIVLDENDVGMPDWPSANKELDDDSLADGLEGEGLFEGRDDYEATRDLLSEAGWNVIYDDTALFLSARDVGARLIAYCSYGSNHGQDGSESSAPGYINQYELSPGAIFNTIESYNARALNGLGPIHGQGQVADFIGIGGAFGIGHVYEPFSFAVPDNEYLLVNFLVNGLSWAEAAWSSIPVLSWQHVVLGDPLARVVRVVDYSADLDGDGDVDLTDFATFQVCFGGREGADTEACRAADLDGDEAVDLLDFMTFNREFFTSQLP